MTIENNDLPEGMERAVITPRILNAIRNKDLKPLYALSELVDNSLGRGRGNASRATIGWDGSTRTMYVLDNGDGMLAVGDLFSLGKGIGLVSGDNGQYGYGGSEAILWLADKVRVITLRNGMVQTAFVNWTKQIKLEEMPLVPTADAWEEADETNTPVALLEQGQGTLITMHVRSGVNIAATTLEPQMAEMYAPGLRAGKELVWDAFGPTGYGERAIMAPRLNMTDPAQGAGHVEWEGEMLPFTVNIGPSADSVGVRYGVRLGCLLRVVRNCVEECFSDDTNVYSRAGIVGNIDLGGDWAKHLSTNKDKLRDDVLNDKLMRAVFFLIKPMLERAKEHAKNVVLDNLALSLQNAFSGATVIRKASRVDVDGEFDRDGEGGVKPGRAKVTPDDTGDRDAKTKGICTIELAFVSDKVMDSRMLRLKIESNGTLMVDVNKDHPVVMDLVETRPLRPLGFHLMVTQQLGRYALKNKNFISLLLKGDRAAQRAVTSRLDDPNAPKDTDEWVADFIMRKLMDKIHPKARAAAPDTATE